MTFRVRSTDGGKTWSAPERIADRADDTGAGASCTLDDGTVLTVASKPDKPLGKPVLVATKGRAK